MLKKDDIWMFFEVKPAKRLDFCTVTATLQSVTWSRDRSSPYLTTQIKNNRNN